MKSRRLLKWRVLVVFLALITFTTIFLSNARDINAQPGNSISGYVFGFERQSVSDINVELLDELSRTVGRDRTDSSGHYFFHGIGSGRFQVRVMPFGTDYEEQIQEVEIVNIIRQTASGETRVSGFSNEQRDFYLKLRKGIQLGRTAAIFVQDIPEPAKKLYDAAILNLNNKKEAQGLENLKSALEIFPKYYLALERLGNEYVRLGHFEAARILLAIAVDVNPRGFKSWYGLAYSLYSLKKTTEGAKAIQTAVELNS